MKTYCRLVPMVVLLTATFLFVGAAQNENSFQMIYSYGGVDFLTRWNKEYIYSRYFDVLNVRVVNRNNVKVTVEYDAVWTYANQVVKTSPARHYLAPGDVRDGEGFNYRLPNDYDGKRYSFSLLNVRVTRNNPAGNSDGSAAQTTETEHQPQPQVADESKRQVEEQRKAEERKSDELARRAREQKEREEQSKKEQDKLAGTMKDLSGAMVKGPHGEFNGDTWYVAFGGGLWMGSIPVIESHSGSGINSYSAPSGALGIGGMLTLEVWPYYGRNIGIGAFGNFAYGAATGGNFGGSVFSGNYGGKGFLGFEAIRAVGEISMGPRSGVTTSDNANIGIDAQGVGSGSYKLNRLGYGIAFKIDEHAYIELMKFDDKPDYLAPAQKLPTVWHAALIWPGGMYGYMEYGNKYPAAGTAVFPLQDADKGEVITFGMCFLLGAFGEPFF